MSAPNKVEAVSHRVIEGKLLEALKHKGTVAILASEDDLDLLINALTGSRECTFNSVARNYCDSLRQLRKEAFGR